MTLTFHVLWLVCALASVVFATAAARTTGLAALFAAAFLTTLAVVHPAVVPDASAIGAAAAAAALTLLCSTRWTWFAVVVGGGVAAVWAMLLQMQGLGRIPSVAVVSALLAATAWQMRRRHTFAPEPMREEALLVVCLTASGLAILPGVLEGWQSATMLNVSFEERASQAIPWWTVALVVASVLGGMAHSVWRSR